MRDPGPTFEHVDDITCEFWSRGQLRRRQVASHVVEHRANWATIAFAFQDLRDGAYGAVRYMLSRWRLVAGRWHRDTGINLRPDTELKAHDVFASWDPRELAAAADAADDDAA